MFCLRTKKLVVLILTALLLVITPAGASAASTGARSVKVGAYVSGSSVSSLSGFESMVGEEMDYYLFFANWESMYGVQLAKDVTAYGRTPIVTWEPHNKSLDDIIDGRYDAYVAAYADGLKSVPGPVLLRPLHEMNGDWYSWGYGRSDNTPEKLVAAWRHIVEIYRSRGADNVKFVWAPNHVGGATWSAESIPSYYPGNNYVDYAAIDGYNWGSSESGARWQSFDQIFAPAYSKITAITSKPVLITETASTELGGSKPEWIRDAFSSVMSSYPQVSGVLWFQANKETNWRVDSSPASLAAFKESLSRLKDTTAPSARVDFAQAETGQVRRLYRGVTLRVDASDRSGVERVVFSVDGKIRRTDSAGACSWRWRTSRVRTGWHSIQVAVYDTLGNLRLITKPVYVSR